MSRASGLASPSLPAHLGDVDVDGPGAGVRGVPPHRGEQLLPGEDPTGAPHQVTQQLELGRGEHHLDAVGEDPAPRRVQLTDADLPHRLGVGRGAGAAAQHGPDPGDQLARAERLGDVVVGTELQPHDAVNLVVAGGQEDHRSPVAALAQPSAQLRAVQPGQADVDDAGDRAQPPGGGQTGGPVGLDVDAVPVPGQVEPDQVGDRALILDHEHQTAADRLTHDATTSRGQPAMTPPPRGSRECSRSVRVAVRAPGPSPGTRSMPGHLPCWAHVDVRPARPARRRPAGVRPRPTGGGLQGPDPGHRGEARARRRAGGRGADPRLGPAAR